jgi:transcriptional regulator with XRE-family HTH domain
MEQRLKLVRKKLGLTQQEMADRLHIKRNTFANYELGRNAPIDAVVTLICREFGINEVWLRTGEGGEDNMFTKVDADDRYSINLGKLSTTDNEMAQRMVNTIAESSPEELKIIEAFMRKCLGL